MFVTKHTKNWCEIITRCQGNLRGWACLQSPTEKRGAPPYHKPQLLCWDQRPWNRAPDVMFLHSFPHTFMFNCWETHFIFIACFKLHFLHRIKEKFSYAFDDICLYSEVSHLLAHCTFRLTSRRFIQELFQDVQFMPVSPFCHIIVSVVCL